VTLSVVVMGSSITGIQVFGMLILKILDHAATGDDADTNEGYGLALSGLAMHRLTGGSPTSPLGAKIVQAFAQLPTCVSRMVSRIAILVLKYSQSPRHLKLVMVVAVACAISATIYWSSLGKFSMLCSDLRRTDDLNVQCIYECPVFNYRANGCGCYRAPNRF
jgi:hypothetical protein